MTSLSLTNCRQAERENRARFRVFDDILCYHAKVRPDRPALSAEGAVTSYATLDRHADQILAGLQAVGCHKGARIAYLGKNDPRYFELMFAAARGGLVLCPISWRLALPEIETLLQRFDVEVLVIDGEYDHYIPRLRQSVLDLRLILTVGEEGLGPTHFDDWRAQSTGAPKRPEVAPEDILLQLHTSGTTGLPKGVMISHANLMAQVRYTEGGELGTWYLEDRVLVPLPIFHVGGTCYALNALYIGATNVLLREAKSALICAAFAREPITKAGFVPAVIQMILNDPGFDPAQMRDLRYVTFGGSPISPALLDEAMAKFDCDFVQMFGMTESTSVATAMLLLRDRPPRGDLLASCGRAMKGFGLRIVGPDGADLPPGETGEILLQSATILQGYHKEPAATQAAKRGGWYHTGDAGYLDAEGYLYIRDRIKDMIISGGENIYPAEVEAALASHPAVLESGVVGLASAQWGEEVRAYVVLRPGQKVSEAALIAHSRGRIAGYKCPKSIRFVDALPRNASGKILKRTLRELPVA